MNLFKALILVSLPAVAVAIDCMQMKQVPASARIHANTTCDSRTDCDCRYIADEDSSWLQCDDMGDMLSFPRLCTPEETSREVDCKPYSEISVEAVDLCTEDGTNKCPDACRLVNNVLMVCDVGEELKGTYPLVCQDVPIEPVREIDCLNLEDINGGALFHPQSNCWNNDGSYCSEDKKCRYIADTFVACDNGNNFVGLYPELCPFVPVN